MGTETTGAPSGAPRGPEGWTCKAADHLRGSAHSKISPTPQYLFSWLVTLCEILPRRILLLGRQCIITKDAGPSHAARYGSQGQQCETGVWGRVRLVGTGVDCVTDSAPASIRL